MALTIEAIEDAKPGIKPDGRETTASYKMWDSKGLYLEVSPTGGKWWRFKYRFGGKEKRLSLGIYSRVSLAMARERRDAFRSLLADGIDPSGYVKAERETKRAEETRQLALNRFTLDNDGRLSIRLGKQFLSLTPAQTVELRSFLDATRTVIPGETPCP